MLKVNSSVVYGDLSINFIFRTISSGRQKRCLTPKEYAIFCLLLDRQETLVRRDEILSMVWSDSLKSESLRNHLDVTVSRLRGKLNSISAQIKILTVRGSGYVMCNLTKK